MNVGSGNSSMTCGDCDLVKVRHHIPSCIKPFYGSTLMAIDFETFHVCRGSAQFGCEVGTDIAPHRRINDVKIEVAGPERGPDAMYASLQFADRTFDSVTIL
jgi:hypothetical protein